MSPQRFNGIGMTSMRTRHRLIRRLQAQGISDPQVLGVMQEIPRHIFVEEALADRSYEDIALPIGHGQTISQPYIVARMTELLIAGGVPQKVLEIGTGCGYQTAVLAALGCKVYSVERIRPLQLEAIERLNTLHFTQVSFRYADGGSGWPERAPFDAIVVAAAPSSVPETLAQQLAVGGRMVIPLGLDARQHLCLVRRTKDGFDEQLFDTVVFVPMLSGTR